MLHYKMGQKSQEFGLKWNRRVRLLHLKMEQKSQEVELENETRESGG